MYGGESAGEFDLKGACRKWCSGDGDEHRVGAKGDKVESFCTNSSSPSSSLAALVVS